MPCYGCQLKLLHHKYPTPLSNTNNVPCHGKILIKLWICGLLSLGLAQNALPQSSDTPAPAPPSDGATVERPDFSVKIPRINPPSRGEYDFSALTQNTEGGIYHLHGNVVIDVFDSTIKADEAEYDE